MPQIALGVALFVVLVFALVLMGGALVLATSLGLLISTAATTLFALGATVAALVAVLRSDEYGHLEVTPPAPLPAGRDPGYRDYWFGPAWRDYTCAVSSGLAAARSRTVGRTNGSVLGHLRTVWQFPAEEFDESWTVTAGMVLSTGFMAGGLAGLVVGGLVAATFLVATSVVLGLLLGGVGLVLLVAATMLRGVELGALKLRGITVECPSCQRRAGIPVYECPGCQELHRRLVPGPLGVLSRTCLCRTELPTLLGRGRAGLRAHCGHDDCQGVLPVGGLTAPTRHLPIVAGKAAGKTVHLMAAIADLQDRGTAGFDFGDDHTRDTFAEVREALSNVEAVPSTLPSTPLRAVTFYVGRESRRRLVYLYDTAGERYQTSDRTSSLRFLGAVAGILFVVDPFALVPVRELMVDGSADVPTHSEEDPAEVLERFTAELRAHRGSTGVLSEPIAVVVTKCDALATVTGAHPFAGTAGRSVGEREQAVRSWLGNVAGEGGLLRQLDASYARVGFFAVSALDGFVDVDPGTDGGDEGTGGENDPPSAPLRWLLDAETAPAETVGKDVA